nr:hypothetical protein [Mycoplasmopsis bovis]
MINRKIIIDRNFLSDKNNKVLCVNNKNISANQLSAELVSYIFPNTKLLNPLLDILSA